MSTINYEDNNSYIQDQINKNVIDENSDVYDQDSDLYEQDSDSNITNSVDINTAYKMNEDSDADQNNTDEKYGDAEIYEAAADNYIFFPVANKLVTPMKDIGLTPNMVTYLSSACTLLAVYYINNNDNNYAAVAYAIGYLLDCIDGKMARKYNMTSKYGMVLDLVSDNVTNLILITILVYKYGYFNWFIPCIFIMTYMISFSYGLNEAISCYKATGNDNFLERRQLEIGKSDDILNNLFLLITGLSYSTYKTFFPDYDEDKIQGWLSTIKEFGPGNYAIFMVVVILNLPKTDL